MLKKLNKILYLAYFKRGHQFWLKADKWGKGKERWGQTDADVVYDALNVQYDLLTPQTFS